MLHTKRANTAAHRRPIYWLPGIRRTGVPYHLMVMANESSVASNKVYQVPAVPSDE